MRYPRKKGKSFQAAINDLRIPLEELEAVAAKYRPQLEGLGVLEGLHPYQEVMLFVWLWKHDREIEDAARGVCDIHVEWSDS